MLLRRWRVLLQQSKHQVSEGLVCISKGKTWMSSGQTNIHNAQKQGETGLSRWKREAIAYYPLSEHKHMTEWKKGDVCLGFSELLHHPEGTTLQEKVPKIRCTALKRNAAAQVNMCYFQTPPSATELGFRSWKTSSRGKAQEQNHHVQASHFCFLQDSACCKILLSVIKRQ